MKKAGYQRRFYQDWYKASDLYKYRAAYKDTELYILTDKPLKENFIYGRIKHYRLQIENYICKDKKFLTSLKPVTVELNAVPIVKEMSRAAKKANVGPMASVAGAIAEFLAKDLVRKKHKEIIIENGGDLFVVTRSPRVIGIYPGKNKSWKGLKIKIYPDNTPLGICASSGLVGHSLSFGTADSVIVLSKNALLADAVATATANRIQCVRDLGRALKFARSVKGIKAVIILFRNRLLSWGNLEFAV